MPLYRETKQPTHYLCEGLLRPLSAPATTVVSASIAAAIVIATIIPTTGLLANTEAYVKAGVHTNQTGYALWAVAWMMSAGLTLICPDLLWAVPTTIAPTNMNAWEPIAPIGRCTKR